MMLQFIAKLITCFILLLVSFYASGQEDSTRKYKHEVSVGIPIIPIVYYDENYDYIPMFTVPGVNFINDFSKLTITNYHIGYQINEGNKYFINCDFAYSVPPAYANSTYTLFSTFPIYFYYFIEMGWGTVIKISKKINLKCGSNLVFNYQEIRYSSGYTFERFIRKGVGPIVGFEFNVTKKISFVSETGVFVYQSKALSNNNKWRVLGSGTYYNFIANKLLSLSLVYKFDI